MFKLYLKACSVIGLTPTFNSINKKLSRYIPQKVLVSAGILLIITDFGYNLYVKSILVYPKLYFTIILTDILHLFLLTVVIVHATLNIYFFKFNDYENLVIKLYEIDSLVKDFHNKEDKIHFYIDLFLQLFMAALGATFHLMYWSAIFGESIIKFYLLQHILDIYYGFLVRLLEKIARTARNNFRLVNDILKNSREEALKEENLRNFVNSIKIYEGTDELVSLFNNLFGLTLFSISMFCMMDILHSINFILLTRGDKTIGVSNNDDVLVHYYCAKAIATSFLAITMLSGIGNNITKESKKVAGWSYLLIHTLQDNSQEIKQLKNDLIIMAQKSGTQPATISAGGFFNMEYSALFTFILNCTSYIIILVQFVK